MNPDMMFEIFYPDMMFEIFFSFFQGMNDAVLQKWSRDMKIMQIK